MEALYSEPPVSVKGKFQNWTNPLHLKQAIEEGKSKYGIYIIERHGKPVYGGRSGVGENTLAKRLSQRLLYAFESGDDLRTLQVRLGIIAKKNEPGLMDKLKTVERVVVRSLKKIGYDVRNKQLVNQFRAGKGGVDVQNVLPNHKSYRSSILPENLRLKLDPGKTWEWDI